VNMVNLNIELTYLDIRIQFWDMRKKFFRIFLHTLDKQVSSISRDPDEMIFGFIDSMCTLSKLYSSILPHIVSSG
jgi:hypothetical protein